MGWWKDVSDICQGWDLTLDVSRMWQSTEEDSPSGQRTLRVTRLFRSVLERDWLSSRSRAARIMAAAPRKGSLDPVRTRAAGRIDADEAWTQYRDERLVQKACFPLNQMPV